MFTRQHIKIRRDIVNTNIYGNIFIDTVGLSGPTYSVNLEVFILLLVMCRFSLKKIEIVAQKWFAVGFC